MSTTVDVDLTFELDRPDSEPVRGHLGSRGAELVLEVSDPSTFAGSTDAPTVRTIAEALAVYGLVVRVEHDGRLLLLIGAVNAPWWQRRLTGSRRIRMAGPRAAWTAGRARARSLGSTSPALPDLALLPPASLFPLAPTVAYRRRNPVTTTHDPARGGEPRLVRVVEARGGDQRSRTWWLEGDTTIGGSPGCDVVLDGLEDLHARLRHDEDDEWLIEAVAGTTRVHGGRVDRQRLRTGSMIQLGEHRLVFVRAEYADHGRPYGGRIGGELGQNTPQPPRT